MAHIVIHLDGPGRGQVYIDGYRLPNVRSLELLAQGPGQGPNTLKLTMLADTVTVAGQAEVEQREPTP